MTTARDVVVMTTHDIGRHLHCYGRKSVVSPNLDALAARGARLTQAFATAPQCSPSRASLASGRYPHSNGVMGLAHRSFDWELTSPHAAALFAGRGFATHLFGGQHVTQHPERLGFDHVHSPNALEEVLAGEEPRRRLYLELNFEETHRPYPRAGAAPPDLEIPGYLPPGPESIEEMAAAEATIERMDAAVARVMAALEKAGRAENAMVVFTTDHGLAMPRAKCTLYDPGLEVALIVWWPDGGIGRGAVDEHLISNIDVLPTLLEAVGMPIPTDVQGRSFLPMLRNEAYEAREWIFGEKTFHSYYDPMRCIRTRSHKYIRNFETGFAVEVPADIQLGAIFRANTGLYSADRASVAELYELDQDPLEEHNLAGIPAFATIEHDLSERLWSWMRETADPLLDGPVPSPRYRQAMKPDR
jgi:arylsulfatase A-like enzyme